MRILKTLGLAVMLMAAVPAYAQDHGAGAADGSPLTMTKVVTIAACALIGGSAFYLIAEWLFVESVGATTTLGGTSVMAVSDTAEHSGIITGMTIFGGSFGAILGGIGYDRLYHFEDD